MSTNNSGYENVLFSGKFNYALEVCHKENCFELLKNYESVCY